MHALASLALAIPFLTAYYAFVFPFLTRPKCHRGTNARYVVIHRIGTPVIDPQAALTAAIARYSLALSA